eukprot:GILJ01011523.1.p1 GENE.GILJ01011523.1~~GILJ01011523.1.p1  ORF type:complete len:337 (+),score=24.02 GILJ01011523.1:69-1079(+)
MMESTAEDSPSTAPTESDDVHTSQSEAVENVKKRKGSRAATRACMYCQRSHMSCEDARPCKRCVKRGIGHLCRDPESKRSSRAPKYLAADKEYGDTVSGSPSKLARSSHSVPFTVLPRPQENLARIPKTEVSSTSAVSDTVDVSSVQYETAEANFTFVLKRLFRYIGEPVGLVTTLEELRQDICRFYFERLHALTGTSTPCALDPEYRAIRIAGTLSTLNDLNDPALIIVDAGRIHSANRAACDLLQMTRTQLHGRMLIFELLHTEDAFGYYQRVCAFACQDAKKAMRMRCRLARTETVTNVEKPLEVIVTQSIFRDPRGIPCFHTVTFTRLDDLQ